MIWLALRMSLHNRTRLAVTLVGVIFSSYLTLTEVALYIGMMKNATAVIRHAGADLWVNIQRYTKLRLRQVVPGRSREAGTGAAGCALGTTDHADVGFSEISRRSPGAS